MDFDHVMKQLATASPFELYRLKVAIQQSLESDEVLKYFKERLYPGQFITYLEPRENRLIRAEVLKLNRTRLLVRHVEDNEKWNVPYYFVNIDEIELPKRTSTGRGGLSRSQLSKGDRVGYISRTNKEVYAEVIRLNQKTATVRVFEDGTEWRVPYRFLFPVLDTDVAYSKLEE